MEMCIRDRSKGQCEAVGMIPEGELAEVGQKLAPYRTLA